MNPDSNKFEELMRTKEELEELSKGKPSYQSALDNALTESLLRPNGEPVPKHWSTFTVNDNVVINDYTFKIAHIGESYMVVEPVGIPNIGEDNE